MSDLQRLIAFLDGTGLGYDREAGDDVTILPGAGVSYFRHSERVRTDFFTAYFDADGEFAGMGREKR